MSRRVRRKTEAIDRWIDEFVEYALVYKDLLPPPNIMEYTSSAQMYSGLLLKEYGPLFILGTDGTLTPYKHENWFELLRKLNTRILLLHQLTAEVSPDRYEHFLRDILYSMFRYITASEMTKSRAKPS